MTFAPSPEMANRFILAQSFDSGAEGSGDAGSIVGALEELSQQAIVISVAAIILAFILSAVWVGFTMFKGGSIGQAFTGVAVICVVALLLGIGPHLIGWVVGMGNSLT